MSRSLKGLLVGSIAIAFVYLLIHAREPLRLNVGDPWSDANVLTSINYVKSNGFLATSFTDILDVGPLTHDSYRYIHYPPLSEIFYGAVGKYLGVSDIGTFRLFALAFSGLAMGLLFGYVRRLYNDRVGLIATTLFSTSLLWMMYADSIHQAPVMQCTAFLSLWGLVRVLETGLRRHYAAMILGALACFFTSYDDYLFLPVAVLFTVYFKNGNPFARGNRHIVLLCALGCLLGILAKCLCVIGAVGWNEFLADLHFQFLERATSAHDRNVNSTIPTMVRRVTLVLTPMVWVTAAFHVLKAIRAPTVTAALRETGAWMLVTALAFLYLFSQLAASQMLASQVLLPFYAIGSALLLDRMLAGHVVLRRLATVWLVVAPLWSFYFMFTHRHAVLGREEVAKTRAYLAAHDPNDFVMTNLMSDGHIQAAFQRHSWAALDSADPRDAPRNMISVFELTGADMVHEIIVNGPESRFIDKALWPLAMPNAQWAITGWPLLYRAKANAVIAEYDSRVFSNLKAVHAEKVLQLHNYSVYRVDRAAMMKLLGDDVPAATHIDFSSMNARRHQLLGWGGTVQASDGSTVAMVRGFDRCRGAHCKTVLTKQGLQMKDGTTATVAQLMIRVEQVCDQRLTFQLFGPGYVRLRVRGVPTAPVLGTTATFTVPASQLISGVNVLEIENLLPRVSGARLYVRTLDISPACAAP